MSPKISSEGVNYVFPVSVYSEVYNICSRIHFQSVVDPRRNRGGGALEHFSIRFTLVLHTPPLRVFGYHFMPVRWLLNK